jgi:hypothetical protein
MGLSLFEFDSPIKDAARFTNTRFERDFKNDSLKLSTLIDASGHTATNTPDLFRTLKLTVAGPG